MKIFVANVDYSVTENQIKEMFARFGDVKAVKLVTDNQTQRSRGYGFVEMPLKLEAYNAIENLDGRTIKERTITVKKASNPI